MGNAQGNLTAAESSHLLASTDCTLAAPLPLLYFHFVLLFVDLFVGGGTVDRAELRRVYERFSNKYSTGFMTRDEVRPPSPLSAPSVLTRLVWWSGGGCLVHPREHGAAGR
jgi:hypothetical protein